ncbi:MAG: OsmC family protein [Longimicrobiales bacterium]
MSDDHIRQSIENAKQYLSEHPDQARYTDRAATALIEAGLRCRVEGTEGALVVTDMPAGVGGEDSAPSPGWLARAAQASCDATVIAMRAAELGIPLRRLEVTVDSESDDRGLLGMDEAVPAGPLNSRIRVRIAAEGVDPERLRELVEWADRHSPVSDAIRRAVPTTIDIEPQ